MRFLTENLALKGVSLALAVGLWLVIAAETTSEIGLSVPLEMQNVPKDLELTGDPGNNVEVRLRASPGVIHALRPADVAAQIDLAGASEGEKIIHLTPEAIHVPFGVQVVRASPATLILRFERTLQREVPIRPRIQGRPAQGFEVGQVTIRPETVLVAGPKSRVERAEGALAEPVSVEGAKGPLVLTRNIGFEDAALRILGSPSVRVQVDIHAEEPEQTFEHVTVLLEGGVGEVKPAAVTVVLEGPEDDLKRLAPSAVKARVRPPEGTEGGSLPVKVEIEGTPGVRVKSVEPSEVLFAPRPRRRE